MVGLRDIGFNRARKLMMTCRASPNLGLPDFRVSPNMLQFLTHSPASMERPGFRQSDI